MTVPSGVGGPVGPLPVRSESERWRWRHSRFLGSLCKVLDVFKPGSRRGRDRSDVDPAVPVSSSFDGSDIDPTVPVFSSFDPSNIDPAVPVSSSSDGSNIDLVTSIFSRPDGSNIDPAGSVSSFPDGSNIDLAGPVPSSSDRSNINPDVSVSSSPDGLNTDPVGPIYRAPDTSNKFMLGGQLLDVDNNTIRVEIALDTQSEKDIISPALQERLHHRLKSCHEQLITISGDKHGVHRMVESVAWRPIDGQKTYVSDFRVFETDFEVVIGQDTINKYGLVKLSSDLQPVKNKIWIWALRLYRRFWQSRTRRPV